MLVTLDDMKNYLGIPLLTTTYDVFLTQQIQTISESIEAYCRRKFEVATYTQKFYLDEMVQRDQVLDTLKLFHFPLQSVISVTVKADELDAGELITDYRINKPTGYLTRRKYYTFFSGCEIIEVIYSSGFTAIPTPITNAVYSLVSERYNKKLNGIDLNFGSDVQSISIPGTISVAYDYSLNDNERKNAFGAILGKYVNTLDYYRSERSVYGSLELIYL
jgi:hypothetical protein